MSTSAARGGYTPPQWDLKSFNCPHCGALAHQEWRGLGYEDFDESGEPFFQSLERVATDPWSAAPQAKGGYNDNWSASQCFSCKQWSLWYLSNLTYPAPRVGAISSPDMPDEVRALHTEAAQVAVVSPRAGAALARAAVERLLKLLDPDAPSGTRLVDYIDRVRPRVSDELAKMLDVVRVVGNQALHVDERPADLVVLVLDNDLGPGVREMLLETANDLVDELITRPRRVTELWEKLPDGVKAKAAAPKSQGPTTGN